MGRPQPPGRPRSPTPRAARPGSATVSSKTMAFTVPGRLPSTSAPSPEHALRLRALRVGSRGARHRCRCSRARGFRHCDPASGAPSPAELGPRTRRGTKARGLDPRSLRTGTKRRSSTSATKPTREHDHGIARSPPRVQKSRASVRSRAPLSPLSGVGSATNRPKPVRHIAAEGPPNDEPCTEHGQRRHTQDARPKPRSRWETVASRGFTGQGTKRGRSHVRR